MNYAKFLPPNVAMKFDSNSEMLEEKLCDSKKVIVGCVFSPYIHILW